MYAKYILAVLAAVFLAAGGWRILQDGGVTQPKTRTWLMVGSIFALVSVWLWWQRG